MQIKLFHGSGSDRFIARQYASRLKTTDASNNTDNGIIARRLILKNAGWEFGNGEYYIPTSAEIKKASKIAYCGWYQSRGTYGSNGVLETDALRQYAFTQQMIWESLRTKLCDIC